MVFSAIMTGTLTWNAALSHRNEFVGTAPVDGSALLQKYERDLDGNATTNPIEGAEFYLFTSEGEQIGGRFLTDENGIIEVRLEVGEYYFEETNPGSGWTFDID